MGEWMSGQGSGLGLLSLLGGVWVGGILGACSSGNEAAAQRDNSPGAARLGRGDTPREPQRIVQHMVPAPRRSNDEASAPSASNGTRAAAGAAVASPKSRGEQITSKHLEAELNRLEAELGR